METPYALSASVTGWKNVVPPVLQLPLPPEVSPRAFVPSYSGTPEGPPSAQTLVWIRPRTVPSAYRTVAFSAWTVPVCVPVVDPVRVTCSPTTAFAAVKPPGCESDVLVYCTRA